MEYIFIFLANKGGYPPPCGAEWEGSGPPLAEILTHLFHTCMTL